MQLILGAVNVLMTIPGLYLIERIGRRVPLVVGGLWQAGWLLVFAIIGIVRPPTEYTSSGIVMIVCACMFIASFAMTWGPFVWVVIGEMFPLRTRAKQASLATAFNWLGRLPFLPQATHFLANNVRQLLNRIPYSLRKRRY